LPPAAPPLQTPREQTGLAETTTRESAEVQATYTTTEDAPAARAQAEDDRYGIESDDAPVTAEPSVLDAPPSAVELESPTPELDAPPATSPDANSQARAPSIANAPIFTADDLAAAVRVAQDAQPTLTKGSLEDGREVQRAKANGYQLLADLAQKTIFSDEATNAASLQAAEELFRSTLADDHTRLEVAKIVPKWIASPHRKHGGVFLAASLDRGEQAGSIIESTGTLDTGQTLTLLLSPTLVSGLDDSARPVGLVGWIVDRPGEQIDGYAGQAQQAIWVGKLIRLE
jgi:hypothetical protein